MKQNQPLESSRGKPRMMMMTMMMMTSALTIGEPYCLIRAAAWLESNSTEAGIAASASKHHHVYNAFA